MTRRRVDTALRIYDEVLGLEHYTYGLWSGEPLTLDGLKSAQLRYAENLIGWIPEGVERILDVGCGSGAFSALLKNRGFYVEGLAPDPRQGEIYQARTGQPFHLSGFAEFRSEHPYDLAILSESSQYVRPPAALFESAIRNVPGGHMLIADYFVTSKEKGPLTRSGHRLAKFLTTAADQGFEIVREEDITDAVTRTLDCARDFLHQRVRPSIRIIEDYGSMKHPHVFRLVRWAVGHKLAELDKTEIMVDSEAFRQAKRYMIYLFRVPKA